LTDEIFWNKADRRVKQLGLGEEFKIDDYDEMGG
jgi:hypothetical protein